jgi:hypothetical protein
MPLLRIASILLFAAMAVYGAMLSTTNFGQATLRNMSEDLIMRRNLTATQVHDAAASPEIDLAVRSCRSDLLDEALSVVLADLNQVNQVADYDEWAKTHGRSQKFLQGMLRCLPMNGNAWIRDAMVSRAIAENPAELKDKLELASQLTPFERQLIVARLSLWKRLSPRALALSAPLIQGDIVSVLRYGTDPVVKALPIGAPDAFRSVMLTELASIGKDRRTVLDLLLGTAVQAN